MNQLYNQIFHQIVEIEKFSKRETSIESVLRQIQKGNFEREVEQLCVLAELDLGVIGRDEIEA
ncbi:hypothetical protein F2Q70_00015007 [Brassica cretica]|uniref:Uncharacterized protein n=1 Tax=Brassica cretica TaxID=69181 RepID=A0A8S9HWF5_BRACR|nr:hypothetical protein F2Q70_00015005 [Brassica cretica]KAF2562401.1 hypothetical protein F2Q70_00015007 [Brassica cretica]KAF2599551.1 hypothetical protein F2Q68_00008097 [Brassica cretica]KAF2599553.1 hypothetical protein F2Q68_00008095 [Brassica cretica]